MMQRFLLLLKHDIYEGIICKWKYFLVALIFFVFIDFVFINNVNALSNASDQVIKCSISDIFLNMFVGNDPFDPESGKGIKLAIAWFLFHTLLFSFAGFYIVEDIKKSATSFMLRVKSKGMWWTSKFLWCVITVLAYYALFFIIAVIFAGACGKLSFDLNSLIASECHNMEIPGVSVGNIVFSTILLPVIISVAIAVFEATLGLILKPIYSFVVVIVYLIASAFYSSACLLFNFSMVIRNNFEAVNGVLNQYGVVIAVIVTIASYLMGLILIKRKDII